MIIQHFLQFFLELTRGGGDGQKSSSVDHLLRLEGRETSMTSDRLEVSIHACINLMLSVEFLLPPLQNLFPRNALLKQCLNVYSSEEII